MTLEGRYDEGDGVVRVAGDARQRFHDSRGYGYPLDGNEIALAPVEAAHLLYRGDLDGVEMGGTSLSFRQFVSHATETDFVVRFLVYADLRERGFYLTPADSPWLENPPESDLAVFPRGKKSGDGEIAYAVSVIGERTTVPATELREGVYAVVDEESEITYFQVTGRDPRGSSDTQVPSGCDADLLADRVVVWEPPEALYERAFYGQPLEGREYTDPTVQCSLLEAAHLAERGVIDVDPANIHDRGRQVEGTRFDRRYRVYESLRERGVVPKTGYKFGADFRTYADVESVADLGHSEFLVRVHPTDHVFEPRDLALDVRLAHGVRKTMLFALVDTAERGAGGIEWWSVERLTP